MTPPRCPPTCWRVRASRCCRGHRRVTWRVVSVDGPARVTAGDSLRYDVTVRFTGDSARDSAVVELRSDDAKRTLLARRVRPRHAAEMRAACCARPARGIAAGEHLLSVQVVDSGDAEPRTDERLVHLSVARRRRAWCSWPIRPTGMRASCSAPSARSRRCRCAGYVRIGDSWRTMTDLKPVSEDVMRQAIRGADLVVLKGHGGGSRRRRARSRRVALARWRCRCGGAGW